MPSIKRLDGTPFTADLNQVLVLYWWASTCPFCALQSPEMDKLYRAMAPKGMAFLGLSIDKTPQRAQDYLKLKGYVWPLGLGHARSLPKPGSSHRA